MSFADAIAELDATLIRLERVSDAASRAAVVAAPEVLGVLCASWAAGQAPDGSSWVPRYRDGAICFPTLSGLASASADGPAVVITVPDWTAAHQSSPFPLMPSRAILPNESALPPSIVIVLERALAAELERA